MPIPFLFIGIGVGAAALGIGKGIKAGIDQKDANNTNQRAQEIVDDATKEAKASQRNSGRAIKELGAKKLWVLEDMQAFIQQFEQIHNIELSDTPGLDELKSFHMDKQSLAEIKEMSSFATSIVKGLAGGAAGGALTALGAYGAATTFATASTGTAIATLSGAAATNATLAFFGGGSLAVGGLGIAGGTAVLGGLVAGPALAIMGFIVGAKAKANKESAYSNLAQASEYREEIVTLRTMCKVIRMRANMFERLLIKLDAIFAPLIDQLADVIQTAGTDFSQYTDEQKNVVAASLSIAKAIKTVLDTPILTEEGTLTEESAQIKAPIQGLLDGYAGA